MKRVLLLGLHYPFAIMSYFRHALEKRPDVELLTAGVYTGDFIPWNGGMRLPQRYVKKVDLPLPPSILEPTWKTIKDKLGKFDLIINCDAGSHLADKPDAPYAVVLTDPHVLGDWYKRVRPIADFIFNMQRYYMQESDHHLPYACSPDHHYPMEYVAKTHKASLIGLHYEQRNRLVTALRSSGYAVLYELGLVFDEYRLDNNHAFVGLNWSSHMDINARTFEIMAMRQIPVINRLPHLDELGFDENRHYLGFDSVDEAIEKVRWTNEYPDLAKAIALNAYQLVHERHTYENRIQQIFNITGV